MKTLFASFLVIIALFTLSQSTAWLHIPRAAITYGGQSLARIMPFGMQVEHARHEIKSLREKQRQHRWNMAEASVRIHDIKGRLPCLRAQRARLEERLREIQYATDLPDETPSLIRQFESCQSLIHSLEEELYQLKSLLEEMESHDRLTDRMLTQHDTRLQRVVFENSLNNLRHAAMPGEFACPESMPALDALERNERVRSEFHQRYGNDLATTPSYPLCLREQIADLF